MLAKMGQAGCWLISWGIESSNEMILKRARKGYKKEQAFKALQWAHNAGIKNWGYFIIGLPGETEETIKETIAYCEAAAAGYCPLPHRRPLSRHAVLL